jgi:hypothetical protein
LTRTIEVQVNSRRLREFDFRQLLTATLLHQSCKLRKRPPDKCEDSRNSGVSGQCLPAPGRSSPSFRLRLTLTGATV